ncbi:hypothetical protein [Corynebacterium xerosis]|uniref:hypothetical protein n=1 Tax=Corynebacterium xerosis TaxID=1725 RepID=UPI0011BE8288|nr:hypothetical protein [Corynebacterium xerosis]
MDTMKRTKVLMVFAMSPLVLSACGALGEAGGTAQGEATKSRVVEAAAAQEFIDSITEYIPEFHEVEPLAQAEWICAEFDKGVSLDDIESDMLDRLREN